MATNAVLLRSAGPILDADRRMAGQRGLITRQQALACGLTDSMIRHLLCSGRWQRILPAVYAGFIGVLTLEQRRLAAFMYGGRHCQLTGVAALRRHGMRYLPDDERIHVLVPHAEQRASWGFVRLQRAKDLDAEARSVNGYVICSVARAVADACRGLDDLRTVRAITAEAVQRGLTSVAALGRELERAGRHRTRLLRIALREVGYGAASAPEGELQAIFGKSRILGHVHYNPALVTLTGEPLPRPDAWLDDAKLAVEVDSQEHHSRPEDWQNTLNRHNILSELGAMVIHLTPSDIRRPGRALRIVERAYRQRIGTELSVPIRVAEDA